MTTQMSAAVPQTQDIAVLVVDDDAFVLETLCHLVDRTPGLASAGCARNGAEAVELAAASGPDVVIMDVQMPVMDGVEAARRILAERPETRVLMWTAFDNDEAVAAALRHGAAGFVLKTCGIPALLDTIRTVHHGMTVIAPDPLRSWTRSARLDDLGPAPQLSAREREVLEAVCQGRTNAEIGRELFLSQSSVKVYVTSLMQKFGVHTRVKLVVRAMEFGLF